MRVFGTGPATVAVVRVEPVTGAPCITNDGQVYQRVTGQTVPVTDTAVLARLFERGYAARSRAVEASERAADRVMRDPQGVFLNGEPHTILAFGLQATEHAEGVEHFLFSDEFTEMARAVAPARLRHGSYEPAESARLRYEQDAVCVAVSREPRGDPPAYQWSIRARWDGSIGIVCYLLSHPEDEELIAISVLFDEVIKPAWAVAAEFARFLGGRGRCRLLMRHAGTEPKIALFPDHLRGILPRGTEITRWVAVEPPTPDDVESVRQEVMRAIGYPAWRLPPQT